MILLSIGILADKELFDFFNYRSMYIGLYV